MNFFHLNPSTQSQGLVYLGRLGGMLNDYDERVAGLKLMSRKLRTCLFNGGLNLESEWWQALNLDRRFIFLFKQKVTP